MIYASALRGYAGTEPDVRDGDVIPLLEAIVENVPPPPVNDEGPLQLQVSSLDYNEYVGVLGIGRITRGEPGRTCRSASSARTDRRVTPGLPNSTDSSASTRTDRTASAGDIVVFSGIEDLKISDTLCERDNVEALPALDVDEPTISMTFQVNKSPFAGREGKYLTSRQIHGRLEQELKHNVALRVEETDDPDRFRVSGRGELHLAILIETMRREGYELAVSRPTVIEKEIDGVLCEPWELVTVDFAEEFQGGVMTRSPTARASFSTWRPTAAAAYGSSTEFLRVA